MSGRLAERLLPRLLECARRVRCCCHYLVPPFPGGGIRWRNPGELHRAQEVLRGGGEVHRFAGAHRSPERLRSAARSCSSRSSRWCRLPSWRISFALRLITWAAAECNGIIVTISVEEQKWPEVVATAGKLLRLDPSGFPLISTYRGHRDTTTLDVRFIS